MKAALITEVQIKTLEALLHHGTEWELADVLSDTLKSLKVQEPVAIVCDAYNCEGLEWLCDAPPRRLSMLFVGEKA